MLARAWRKGSKATPTRATRVSSGACGTINAKEVKHGGVVLLECLHWPSSAFATSRCVAHMHIHIYTHEYVHVQMPLFISTATSQAAGVSAVCNILVLISCFKMDSVK